MTINFYKLPLGEVEAIIINVGDYNSYLARNMLVPDNDNLKKEKAFPEPLLLSLQCILIRLPSAQILIDASRYMALPSTPYALPNYVPPPALDETLKILGTNAETIDHVILTHAHFDHYNGTTTEKEGHYVPIYKNARHYLGKSDWKSTEIQMAIKDPQTPEGQALGVLYNHNLLQLVDGEYQLSQEISILPAPGETPGHQIVCINSKGKFLFCIGDIFHHPAEVEHLNWMARWADYAANLSSRNELIKSALESDAYLVATHISGIGQLRQINETVRWVPLLI